MNLNSEYIINTFYSYQLDKTFKTEDELNEKYLEFRRKYPKIYDNFVNGLFTVEKFKQLLSIHNNIYNNTAGTHKKKNFESSAKISETLAKEYLYPVYGEPSQQDKNKARLKAMKKLNK